MKSSLLTSRKITVHMVAMQCIVVRLAAGGLEQAINRFEEAIGLPGLHPSYDAIKMVNALILEDKQARDVYLKELNEAGVMSRPIWRLMNELTMFNDCQSSDLSNSKWLEERVVNIPSSARVQ